MKWKMITALQVVVAREARIITVGNFQISYVMTVLKRLENDEVVHTVRKIFIQTVCKQLDKTLLDFAFHE